RVVVNVCDGEERETNDGRWEMCLPQPSQEVESCWAFLVMVLVLRDQPCSANKMLFRVIISQQDIHKLKLDSVPDSVDGLKLILRSNLQLTDSFDLQYEDEDFHDFCHLTCIADLPKEKVTLRVLFSPYLPQGRDRKNLKEERNQMIQDMKKRNPGLDFVDTRMSSTYSLRKQEIVEDEPPVSELMVRWLALFTERQASNQRKRTAVLQALPWYLRENPSKFLKLCEPTDRKDVIKGMTIGILAVVEDVKEPLPAIYSDVVLVMEEHAILRKLGDVPNAFMNLMGLLYALNMNYPKDLRYTFEVNSKKLGALDDLHSGASMCSGE
ncbi:hypothetical protein NFI96_007764, partial [Prochilodus magdalenae]